MQSNDGSKHLFVRLAGIWTKMALALGAVAGFYAYRIAIPGPEEVFFWRQDLPVLVLAAGVLWVLPRLPFPLPVKLLGRRPAAFIGGLAVLAMLVGGAGAFVVFETYTLSLDEYLADFDAAIFRRGALMAEVPQEWRALVPALQPIYMLETPERQFWASSYLPLNAAFRAVGGLVGVVEWVNALWAAVSVVAVYAVARRLWPDRREMALGAAVLLATSSQFLITAMTAYAMSAHLALNLVWLWLFLRSKPASDAAAIGIGFVASGLHQVIFHPLFVAPFVLELLIARSWRRALVFAGAYAAIGVFWIAYWGLLYRWLGIPPEQAQAVGGTWFASRVMELVSVDIQSVNQMAECLVRFVTWQNLLVAPLALWGGGLAFRAGGVLRALAVGVILTTLAMLVLVPSQTHGWGYRYLHGLLGSACLLAVFAWSRATAGLAGLEQERANAAFGLACVLSLLVLTPVRAWQSYDFSHPFAAANATIQASKADVVLVDNGTIGFDMGSLVRNDPFLEGRPKVMLLNAFNEKGLTTLCGRYSVWVFDATHPSARGMQTYQAPWRPRSRQLRDHLASLNCGA